MAGQDLGTDTGSVALNLGTKLGEALMKLLEKIFQAWRDAPHRKLEKQKLAEAKGSVDKAKLIKRMDKKSDIALQKLKEYAKAKGDTVISTGIIFKDEKDMKAFSEYAKKQGIVFSGVHDKKTGEYHIFTASESVPRVKGIIERITDDKKILAIDNTIEKIKSKGELSDQDKVNIQSLEKAKQDIQDKYSYRVNEQTFEGVIDDIVNEKPEKSHGENERAEKKREKNEKIFDYEEFSDSEKDSTLSQALDRYTDGELTRDIDVYVVDAREPDRFVVAHGENDTYNDKDYIKTTYAVHNPDGQMKEFNDGRFDGRPKNYWQKTKGQMLAFGGFDKDAKLLRFTSKNEFERWSELTKAQNTNENIKQARMEEYSTTIEAKQKELSEKGYFIDESGNAVRYKELLVQEEGFTADMKGVDAKDIARFADNNDPTNRYFDMRLEASEAIVIAKEINNYRELIQNAEDISMAKANVIIADTPEEKTEAEQVLQSLQEKRSELVGQENELINERKGINACQAEQERRAEKEYEHDRPRETERAEHEAEHGNGERDERGTMEEYEGAIKEEREKESVSHGEEYSTDKSNDGKNGAEKGTEKASKKPSRDRAD